MKKISYDLTSIAGQLLAAQSLDLEGAIYNIGFICSPTISVLKILKDLFSNDSQCKNVEKLIQKGKEDGVSEMDIKMKNFKGLHLDVPTEGVDISCKVGSDETIEIKVKYK